MLRPLGRKTGTAKVHAHRLCHTFATRAIQHGAIDVARGARPSAYNAAA
jgi:site-specific recombinase XerD